MNEVTIKAPAKLNLWLRAGPRQADGYHPLLTVFQAVDLYERITLRSSPLPGVHVSITGPYSHKVPMDQSNLATQAVQAVADFAGITPEVQLHIDKTVPVAAGLAGGSADAAATLRLLNRVYETGLSAARLEYMAAQVDSDASFCIRGGTQLAEGRGERLTPLKALPLCQFVLCKPPYAVSTGTVFAQWGTVAARHPIRPD
ncbi:MAG: 4-(cytidine 5'-diphospho)-2-C-methyl-D-erythritol kinase, partial [Micrococcales bacterium]|nr:4-(cytidine 5'-diphospho)-2-C-methyl-D-erythritol kinase [Micrococcales bacterium]